jgi:hypothetical protein
MSSTIGVCPDCGKIGAHADLPAQTVSLLELAVVHTRLDPDAWSIRGHWCPHCEAVYLVVWTKGIDLPGRRALLAPAGQPIEINEEEGEISPIPEADLFSPPAGDVLDQPVADPPQISETTKKPRKGDRRTP